MHRRALALLLIVMSSVALAAPSLDRALVDALVAKDVPGATRALERGADPNAVLGPRLGDNAMCAAIDDRGTELFELLLAHGGNIHYNLDQGDPHLRTPLACAISYYNPEVFERLLELGADVDEDLCSECNSPVRRNAFDRTLATKQYPMTWQLLQYEEPNADDLKWLVNTLEQSPADALHPWNPYREALIRWVRDRGIPITPREASTIPGEAPYCVFSVRDEIEGRTRGSICPDGGPIDSR